MGKIRLDFSLGYEYNSPNLENESFLLSSWVLNKNKEWENTEITQFCVAACFRHLTQQVCEGTGARASVFWCTLTISDKKNNLIRKLSCQPGKILVLRQIVDALVARADEGRWRQRYTLGRCQSTFDPAVSEWGNLLWWKSECLKPLGFRW